MALLFDHPVSSVARISNIKKNSSMNKSALKAGDFVFLSNKLRGKLQPAIIHQIGSHAYSDADVRNSLNITYESGFNEWLPLEGPRNIKDDIISITSPSEKISGYSRLKESIEQISEHKRLNQWIYHEHKPFKEKSFRNFYRYKSGFLHYFTANDLLESFADNSGKVPKDEFGIWSTSIANILWHNPVHFLHHHSSMIGNPYFSYRPIDELLKLQKFIIAVTYDSKEFDHFVKRTEMLRKFTNTKDRNSEFKRIYKKSDDLFLEVLGLYSLDNRLSSVTSPVSDCMKYLLSFFNGLSSNSNDSRKLAEMLLRDIGKLKDWDFLPSLNIKRNYLRDDSWNFPSNTEPCVFPDANGDRHDFGNLLALAIDDFNVTEVDDAVSLEEENDGCFWFHVHIADPTSTLDLTSNTGMGFVENACTIYLPDGNMPMLNTSTGKKMNMKFWNDFANQWSLSEGSMNRTITVSCKVNQNMQVLDKVVRRGILRNIKKISYDEVDAILNRYQESSNDGVKIDPSIERLFGKSGHPPSVFSLKSLGSKTADFSFDYSSRFFDANSFQDISKQESYIGNLQSNVHSNEIIRIVTKFEKLMQENCIRRNKYSRTSLTLSIPRPQVQVNYGEKENQPKVDIMLDLMYLSRSRQAVAEAMIIAGEQLADFTQSRNIPFIYRCQEQQIVEEALNDTQNPSFFNEEIKKLNVETSLQILADLKPSETPLHPKNHEMLGLKKYCQITSPLRRSIDLINHWQLKAFFVGGHSFKEHELERMIPFINRKIQKTKRIQSSCQRFWAIRWLLGQSEDFKNRISVFILPQKIDSSGVEVYIKCIGAPLIIPKRELQRTNSSLWAYINLNKLNTNQLIDSVS